MLDVAFAFAIVRRSLVFLLLVRSPSFLLRLTLQRSRACSALSLLAQHTCVAMAILSIMVVNNHGHPRLLKFYKEVVS